MTARLVLDCKDVVGESLVWSLAEQALYWVDIVGSRIHRLAPATGAHRTWPTPEYPTSIGLRKDGGFIVGLRKRVCLWRPGSAFETFAVPEPDLPGNRLNEGVVAPDGSFWVGTMAENIGPDGGPQEMSGLSGALYRIAPDGTIAQLTERNFGIPNTMVWLDDGRFVTADTLLDQLYAYAVSENGTRLSGRIEFGPSIGRGLPDGSTRDAGRHVYNARVAGGAAIAVLDRTGAISALLELPCSSPTSCTFGGAGLDTLYVTSARFGMSEADLAAHPIEGGLFAIDGAGQGVSPSLFG